MKVFHGSKNVVDKPIPHGSKNDNDYGAAFYLTSNLESAHEWACRNDDIGVVNEYDLALSNLKVLDLTDKSKYSVLNWLAILLHFRKLDKRFVETFRKRLEYIEKNYYIDVSDYDVIIGFRADDAYFRFPLDFIRGNLTISQLEYAYKLGNLGVQYVLISEKSFSHLKYLKSFLSEERYISKYFINMNRTSKIFDSLEKDEDGVRIIDLMKGE